MQTVGGGWITAQNAGGQTGLVPEGYLQVSEEEGHSLTPPLPHLHQTTSFLQIGGGGGGDSWSGGGAYQQSPAGGDDDDGEWDDDWDDQSVSSYHGNGNMEEEAGTSGRSTHGHTVKISLNK